MVCVCVCMCVCVTADITSSCDIEQCLKEAAYMKDFHHANVIQLIGNTHTVTHITGPGSKLSWF